MLTRSPWRNGKAAEVRLVTIFHCKIVTSVIVLLPEWEFYIVFIHSYETEIEEEKRKVCIHFSVILKKILFTFSNTIMVPVGTSTAKSIQIARLGVKCDVHKQHSCQKGLSTKKICNVF